MDTQLIPVFLKQEIPKRRTLLVVGFENASETAISLIRKGYKNVSGYILQNVNEDPENHQNYHYRRKIYTAERKGQPPSYRQ